MLGFLEKEEERKRERKKRLEENKSGSFPYIHRRVRNYEIPKITLLQIKGYYILPSLQKFILEFYNKKRTNKSMKKVRVGLSHLCLCLPSTVLY